MIFRFCLYGLLKNQRYFAPFWILAFLDKGLSFAMIGLLIGFREICVALLEIPTGAIADAVGRRWAMILSHVAYVAAFLTFGFTTSLVALFVAMFAFSIGEAFRTGTHKAIIFAWLKSQGREKEKTHIYGVTRSWSQMGSAISVVLAAALVFWLEDYSVIFWISAIPASLNIVNFLGYPKSLDFSIEQKTDGGGTLVLLWRATWQCFAAKNLRRPITESMAYEGMYGASKDYLQPLIQNVALALPLFAAWETTQRTAVLIAIVYAVLYVLGSFASRYSGPIAAALGSERRAARYLWIAYGAAFLLLLLGIVTAWTMLAILSFVLLAVMQNIWRPILISRVADEADDSVMATVLSVESQAKSLGISIIAPLLGWAVDVTPQPYQFTPIAMLGIAIALIALVAPPEVIAAPEVEGNQQTSTPG
ncbi:MFS transporter [Blastopirellula sp. JC732]|uniref:MFS transporter n=1 Tax=Blastopirellula sediminis TaxID=2894196 RepID=A0A9X1MNI1_9BACT|nr:MFS transporter [Blastopirellula sediminis]MCC9606189.1 MFS transporter [Blastopirellula sediminis]MCC9630513.1 MFS transporter [Blastopirellula sediminis]